MKNPPKKKLFYQIDEVSGLLGLSLLDLSVLVSEQRIKICTTVADMHVEDGHLEPVPPDGKPMPIPGRRLRIRGLVDLQPDDAWFVLRQGSQTIFWLAAEPDFYRRLISTGEEDRGYTVIRDEVGVRHEELMRFAAQEESGDEQVFDDAANRRSRSPYDWEPARLEAFRRIYFEGVPQSFGALIRHMQAWFAAKGGRVPDESTLKRRFRDIWVMFGPEAQTAT